MLLTMCETGKSGQKIGSYLEECSSSHTSREETEHLESLLLDTGFQDFLHLESNDDLFDASFLAASDKDDTQGFNTAGDAHFVNKSSDPQKTTLGIVTGSVTPMVSVSHPTCLHRPNETHSSICYQEQQQISDSNKQLSMRRRQCEQDFGPSVSKADAKLPYPGNSIRGGNHVPPLLGNVYRMHQNSSSFPGTIPSPAIQVQSARSHSNSTFTAPTHCYQGNFTTRQPFRPLLDYQVPQNPNVEIHTVVHSNSAVCSHPNKASKNDFLTGPPFYESQNAQYLDSTVKTAESASQNVFPMDYTQQGSCALKADPNYSGAEVYRPLGTGENNAVLFSYSSSPASSSSILQTDSSCISLTLGGSTSEAAAPPNSGSSFANMNLMAQPSSVETLDELTSLEMTDTESYFESQMETGQDGRRQQKLNHSEIEKRRRDKMNSYIVELAGLVPMCRDLNRKLDKLSVLRMAVQHIKTLRGSCDTVTEVSHLPSFFPEEGVKDIILKASEGFIFAVSCDRGKILFASESVADILHYKPAELTGQNLFDFIHQRDILKVKDQLAAAEFLPKEKYIDAKTMKLVKTSVPCAHSQLSSGNRRLFVCRMKKKTESLPQQHDSDFKVPYAVKTPFASYEHIQNKQNADDASKNQGKSKQDSSFVMVRCIGYIKQKVTTRSAMEDEEDQAGDTDPMYSNCLIAVAVPTKTAEPAEIPSSQSSTGNTEKMRSGNPEFMSRHSLDGKIVFVDHRVTGVLGYVPQEMMGTSIYEYCHPDYIQSLSQVHKKVLKDKKKLHNQLHKFRTRNGASVMLSTTLFVFVNPWTKESEQLICTHQLTVSAATSNFVTSSTNEKKQNKNIGADQQCGDTDVTMNLAYLESEEQKVTSSSDTEVECSNGKSDHVQQQQQHQQSEERTNISQIGRDIMVEISRHQRQAVRRNLNLNYASDSSSCQESSSGTENTDEAAMSIIMNLLEAEAGLGGPVDFNDLPWPL